MLRAERSEFLLKLKKIKYGSWTLIHFNCDPRRFWPPTIVVLPKRCAEYKIGTRKGTSEYATFGNAKEGTIFKKVFEEKMKNLPHGQFFTYFVNNLRENGVLEKLARKYILKPRSDCGTSGEFVSVGFTNTLSAFVMLIVASLVAIAVCVSECLVKIWVVKKTEI